MITHSDFYLLARPHHSSHLNRKIINIINRSGGMATVAVSVAAGLAHELRRHLMHNLVNGIRSYG